MIFTKKKNLTALFRALSLIGLLFLSACASLQVVEEDPLVLNDPDFPETPGIIETLTGKKLEVGI